MLLDNAGWVPLPKFTDLNKKGLKYQDALTYIAIRSFLNTESRECFPAYETIGKLTGMSRNAIRSSIQRLKNGGIMDYKVSKSSTTKNNSNRYSFKVFTKFDQVPMAIFEASDLTYHEKGMLICLRQFFPNKFSLENTNSKELSLKLGITEQTLNPKIKSLIDKGYVLKTKSRSKKHKFIYFQLSTKIRWIYPPGQAKPIEVFSNKKFKPIKIGSLRELSP